MSRQRTKAGRRKSFRRWMLAIARAGGYAWCMWDRCLDCGKRGCWTDHAAENAYREHTNVY